MYFTDKECLEEGLNPHPLRRYVIGRMPQSRLAQRIGCSVQGLNQFLLGKRNLDPRIIYQLEKVIEELELGVIDND